MTHREYCFLHVAGAVETDWLTTLQRHLCALLERDEANGLEAWIASERRATSELRWSIWIQRDPGEIYRWALRELPACEPFEDDAEQVACLQDACALARERLAQSGERAVRRSIAAFLDNTRGRLERIRQLNGPAFVERSMLLSFARGLRALEDPAAPCPEPRARLERVHRVAWDHPRLPNGTHALLSPFEAMAEPLHHIATRWLPDLGAGSVAAWPPIAMFLAEHERAWPTTQTFWDIHGTDDLREATSFDVYPQPDLWRLPGLSLPRRLVPEGLSLAARVADILQSPRRREGERPARAGELGTGRKGGPMTWAAGAELAAWGAATTPGVPEPMADAVTTFKRRCRDVGGRGGAMFSVIWLDADEA